MQNDKGILTHGKRVFCCLLLCCLFFPFFLADTAHADMDCVWCDNGYVSCDCGGSRSCSKCHGWGRVSCRICGGTGRVGAVIGGHTDPGGGDSGGGGGGGGGTSSNKPTILTEPKNVTVNVGEQARFSVTALDAASYQWYYRKDSSGSWTAVSNNGTSATYTLTTQERHNGYQYFCRVTNSDGGVSSDTVTLAVITKPVITAQPSSVTVEAGKTATFKVSALGAKSYRWYYRKSSSGAWTAVSSNGTSATYKLTTAARHKGYQYRCLVKNSHGSAYSKTVTLTVIVKPVITAQPKAVTVDEGKAVRFKVTATGAKSYQWYYWSPSYELWREVKNNGTSAAYSLTAEARHNGNLYRCKVTNSDGSVYTKSVKLTVHHKPVITAQPSSVTVIDGRKATFKVSAIAAESYQWYYRKSASGAWTKVKNNGASATYSLAAETRHNGYQYRCLLKNTYGSVYTGIVKLTVKNKVFAEKLTLSKTAATVRRGTTLTLSAKVSPAASTITEAYKITWSSSNEDVATVSSTGTVKGKTPGAATITAALTCSGRTTLKATCKVTVKNEAQLLLDYMKKAPASGGKRVITSGDASLTYDPNKNTYTFLKDEGYTKSSLTCGTNFKGNAQIHFYYESRFGSGVLMEGKATEAISKLTRDRGYDWTVLDGIGYYDMANSSITVLWYSIEALVKQAVDATLPQLGFSAF